MAKAANGHIKVTLGMGAESQHWSRQVPWLEADLSYHIVLVGLHRNLSASIDWDHTLLGEGPQTVPWGAESAWGGGAEACFSGTFWPVSAQAECLEGTDWPPSAPTLAC